MRPRKPERSPLLVGNAAVVVGVSAFVVLRGIYGLFVLRDPGVLCGAVCLMPLFSSLGAAQFLGAFRWNAGAARLAEGLSIFVMLVCGLGALVALVGCFAPRNPWDPDVVRWFVLLTVAGGYAFFTARLNGRWTRELDRPLPAGFCVYCGYDLRASPGRCPECGGQN